MTSTVPRICMAITLLLSLSAPGSAQQIGPDVASDLDGDGAKEQFRLVDLDDDFIVDLLVQRPGGEQIVARDIAWIGGVGQEPALSLAPNGSVLLASMNESVGRIRWRLTLTIAYRRGAYRVAGYTYDWYDTLETGNNGICDLNLLNGKGTLQIDGGPVRSIRTTLKALPITEWADDVPVPPECNSS